MNIVWLFFGVIEDVGVREIVDEDDVVEIV